MLMFANPQDDTNVLRLVLASGNVDFPSLIFANDETHGMYWDVNGLHLTGLATPTDTTDAANKAYVDATAGTPTFPLLAPDNAPIPYSFASDPTSGLFFVPGSPGTLWLTVANENVIRIQNPSQSTIPFYMPAGALGLEHNGDSTGPSLWFTNHAAGISSLATNQVDIVSFDNISAYIPLATFNLAGATIQNDLSVTGLTTTNAMTVTTVTTTGTLEISSTTASTGAAMATFTNSPVAGDPTTYFQVSVNGVLYWIPGWAV